MPFTIPLKKSFTVENTDLIASRAFLNVDLKNSTIGANIFLIPLNIAEK